MAFKSYSQNFTKNYRVVFEKSSLYFTSPMKNSKCKCNRKTPKNQFNFDSIKISFWVHKVTGIKILFPNFHKKLLSGFLKKAHFTLPLLWKFLGPNVTTQKNPFNFDSIQNSFWAHKVTGIRMLFTTFHKKLSSSFWEKFTLLHPPYENF